MLKRRANEDYHSTRVSIAAGVGSSQATQRDEKLQAMFTNFDSQLQYVIQEKKVALATEAQQRLKGAFPNEHPSVRIEDISVSPVQGRQTSLTATPVPNGWPFHAAETSHPIPLRHRPVSTKQDDYVHVV